MFIGVPFYGPIGPRFYQNYMSFVSRAAASMREAGFTEPIPILTITMPYVDHADTAIVSEALKKDNWDYLCLIEQDNIIPEDWCDVVVNQLDPNIHHVVGRWYFGKVQEDQRSVCGYLRPSGDFDRLSYQQVQYFRKNRGLYRVGAGQEGVDDSATSFVVGLGCTAIHRSVLENWTGRMPWFQSLSTWDTQKKKIGYLGQDVNFCMEAAKQGFHVWIDTRKASGHVGEFVADDETYTGSAQYAETKGTVNLVSSENMPQKGIPTAMSEAELGRLNELARDKTVLEIGSRYGASTIGMAGMGARAVYALDWHKGDKWHEAAGLTGDTLTQFWLHVNHYQLRDKIIPLVGSSQQVLPTLRQGMFDLIFIDGDHSYEGVKYDLEQSLPLLAEGGVVVLHDYEREALLDTPYEPGHSLELGVTRASNEIMGQPDEVVDTLAVFFSPIKKLVAA